MRDLKNNSFQSAQHLSESIKNNVSVFSFESIFFDDSKNYLKIKNSDINSEGNYPVIDQGEKFLAGYTDIEPKILKEEDCIVFGDHSKIFKFVNFPFVKGADGTKVLKIKNKNFNTKYFYYFFQSLSLPDLGYTRYYKILKETNVPVLSISQQNKLVNILDRTDELIIIRKEQIQAYDDLIESLFFEMFGDIRFNNNNFSMKKWKEVLNIVNGKNQKKVENPNGKYPIYGSGGIMSYADDWLTKENSIIIGRKGNINKPIFVKEKFWNVDTAFGLEPLEELINADYLFGFCKIFNFERLNKAVTIPSLTKKDLLDIDIPVPPIEMQNKFADYVLKIEEEKKKLRESLEELETLFDALMQDAFSGNLFKD